MIIGRQEIFDAVLNAIRKQGKRSVNKDMKEGFIAFYERKIRAVATLFELDYR